MRFSLKYLLFPFFVSICIAAAMFPVKVFAFAITPPSTSIRVAKGSSFHVTVSLQKETSLLAKDVPVSMYVNGEFQDVITLEQPRFVIPAGQLWMQYDVRGHVGQSLPNGTQTIVIFFREEQPDQVIATDSTAAINNGAHLIMQLSLKLLLDVTGDQISSSDFLSAKMDDTEASLPLLLQAQFLNTGTVLWKPEQVNIKLQSVSGTGQVYEFQFPITELIDPSVTYTYKLSQKHQLPLGRYKGTATAIGQNITPVERDIAPFNVLAENSFATKLQIKYVMSDRGVYLVKDEVSAEVLTENVGTIRTLAVVTADLYLDGVKIDTQVSQPLMIEKADTGLVRFSYKDVQKGTYQIRAHVDYAGKTTAVALKDFSVVDRPPVMIASKEGNLLDVISSSAQTVTPLAFKVALARIGAWLGMSYCIPAPYWLIVLLLIIIIVLLILLLLNAYRRRQERLRSERLARIVQSTEQKTVVNSNVQNVYSVPQTPSTVTDPEKHDDGGPKNPTQQN